MTSRRTDGTQNITRAVGALAERLPVGLAPLARLAYNYRWSWSPDGPAVFSQVSPDRWSFANHNPVRMLEEAPAEVLARAAADEELTSRARALEEALDAELGAPPANGVQDRPVAFLCAEYGIHGSLPIYAGGLGVLAGDILKESSDQRVALVGVGLLYRQGYFHQRLDASGRQHEYWSDADPGRLPAALVTGDDETPLTVSVRLRGHDIAAQIWRAEVGRVPLFLLDTHVPENSPSDRWITARLYVGDRRLRLAQYAMLGLGGIRALRAMGIEPGLVHLNEGHAALAPLELARGAMGDGGSFDEALADARERTLFTTHTPVAAGNETYAPEEIEEVLGDLPGELGIDRERFLALGRTNPTDPDEWFGLTALGLHASRAANAVSRRHGQVAREMWRPLYPSEEDVPIGHVTNGVHLPTWMSPAMQSLLDRHLDPGWRSGDETAWATVEGVPDEELWTVRQELRSTLVDYVRERTVADRLAREEPAEYAEAAARSFDPSTLTIGFARRVAGYKRLTLLVHDPDRAMGLIAGPRPIQLLVAGKAHPQDELAKGMLQSLFALKLETSVQQRVAFLEDYDMRMAAILVAGCDVWVNVPRPPLEASGTSGMKAALNGALNLSVLDGWWEEAFDGTNGWGMRGAPDLEPELQDERDAAALYDVLENDVIPRFHDRGPDGIPRGWLAIVKASLRTAGSHFTAARMVQDYVKGSYLLS
jgi:starch phosphorylase